MNIKLKQLREKRGLSQAEVAQEIGISRQMYNKYERGDTEPSLSVIRSLCTLYDISYEDLLGKENSSGEMEVASPTVAYKSPAYGTENYYAKILALLPHLLLSEKSRLLSEIADSITSEVEGRKSQPMKVNQNDVYIPTEEEYKAAFKRTLKIVEGKHYSSNGAKWTREEMHER